MKIEGNDYWFLADLAEYLSLSEIFNTLTQDEERILRRVIDNENEESIKEDYDINDLDEFVDSLIIKLKKRWVRQ